MEKTLRKIKVSVLEKCPLPCGSKALLVNGSFPYDEV